MKEKRRRTLAVILFVMVSVFISLGGNHDTATPVRYKQTIEGAPPNAVNALASVERLAVKGRAPKTGYDRTQFLDDWGEVGGCDMRDLILRRDLKDTFIDPINGCRLIRGTLEDPYTGKIIHFQRGPGTSAKVQIDHVVALSDAWQKGAQQLSYETRNRFANDPLNLLAVDGPANQRKGAGDAATWLPPNKGYRCRYVARQIAVKLKYSLWITSAEKDAFIRLLQRCPDQVLPVEEK